MGLLIFENNACLVINKLAGESSERPGLAHDGEFFPVHRLDTPVSGCLLLAANREAAAFLCDAFARQTAGGPAVEKRYWAIVERPDTDIPPEAELVHLIRENRKLNKSFALPPGGPAVNGAALKEARLKEAILRYRLAGQGERYLFLEIDLVTGRHHQIRAQLAAVGLHIKGDLKYGAKRSEKGGGIRLHAYSLSFPNPLNPAETIRVKAPPPVKDALWEAFAETVQE